MARTDGPIVAGTDTFDRSCAHWSEAGRRGMEQFYQLAGEDYRQLSLAIDWSAWLAGREREAGGRELRLLDVACGSGKFPSALARHAAIGSAGLAPISYDLLDPSAFSLAEARSVLEAPFSPGREFETRLQDFAPDAGAYDIVWATHALYAIPASELKDALGCFMNALRPGGIGVIAHACEDAHYLAFYRHYLEAVADGRTPYSSAEEIAEALGSLGAEFEAHDIRYEARADATRTADVEGYLQRCVFDDSMSLDAMQRHAAMADYLAGCRDAEDWCFRQHVKLFFLTAPHPGG